MLTSFSFSLLIIVDFKESSATSAGGLLPVLGKKYRKIFVFQPTVGSLNLKHIVSSNPIC